METHHSLPLCDISPIQNRMGHTTKCQTNEVENCMELTTKCNTDAGRILRTLPYAYLLYFNILQLVPNYCEILHIYIHNWENIKRDRDNNPFVQQKNFLHLALSFLQGTPILRESTKITNIRQRKKRHQTISNELAM